MRRTKKGADTDEGKRRMELAAKGQIERNEGSAKDDVQRLGLKRYKERIRRKVEVRRIKAIGGMERKGWKAIKKA